MVDVLYAIDILLTFCSKYFLTLDPTDMNVSMRPNIILLIETLSVVPLSLLELIETDHRYRCMLRLNTSLRMARIWYFFHRISQLIRTTIAIKLVQMISWLTFTIMFTYSAFCNVFCMLGYCTRRNPCSSNGVLIIITCRLLFTRLSLVENSSTVWRITNAVSELFAFHFIYCVLLVNIMVALINSSRHRFEYHNKRASSLRRLAALGSPDRVVASTSKLFRTVWSKRDGYMTDDFETSILSAASWNEIKLDLSWVAFKHSHIFRSCDLAFLRHVALLVREEFKFPGDVVYKRGEYKHEFVYLVSGTVELLSEEDEESPVMALNGGTCLGEICLFVSYKSRNIVRCKTFCQFHVVRRKDFAASHADHPRWYVRTRNRVTERLKLALKSKTLADACRTEPGEKGDASAMLWLKYTLHKLMSTGGGEAKRRHQLQNVYLKYDLDHACFEKLLFAPDHLDLLAIDGRLLEDVDTVFAKPGCPCILQPVSFVTVLLEVAVVACSLYLVFAVPYVISLHDELPGGFLRTLTVFTLLFWLDVYVQVSTSVHTKYGALKSTGAILLARCRDVYFWMDVVTCVPTAMLHPFLFSTLRSVGLVPINQLGKLWRIEKVFKRCERRFGTHIVFVRYLKFFALHAYVVYLLCCYLINKLRHPVRSVVFYSVQLVTGVGITAEPIEVNWLVISVIVFVCSMVNVAMCGSIGSAFVLSNLNRLKVQQSCSELFKKIGSNARSSSNLTRARNYVLTQWIENECFAMKRAKGSRNESKLINGEAITFLARGVYRKAPLFAVFDDAFINELCGVTAACVYPPREVVTCSGDLTDDVHVLERGALSGSTQAMTYATLNFLETAFGIATSTTFVTSSHCRFLTFKFRDFRRILAKYPRDMDVFQATVLACRDVKIQLVNLRELSPAKTLKPLKVTAAKSYHNFGFELKHNSAEEYDFYIPYDELFPFCWVLYLLLRVTFHPDGKFVFVWECCRCFLAVVSSVCHFFPPFLYPRYNPALQILNFTAFLDLYVRLHVSYYDERGLLVYHPLKTAAYYMSHGFLIDFIAAFPVDLVVRPRNLFGYVLVNGNKLLQMHRYFQLFNCLEKNSLTPVAKWFVVMYIPPVVVLGNFLAFLLINYECSFGDGDVDDDADAACPSDSLLLSSPFAKPISPARAHLIGVYVTTSLLTTIGWQGFEVKTPFVSTFVTVVSAMGLYIQVGVCSAVFKLSAFRQSSLLEYQSSMRSLKSFLKSVHVDESLVGVMVEHFEVTWRLSSTRPSRESVKSLSFPLEMDILYESVGRVAFQVSPFKSKSSTFYRNLLPHLRCDTILKDGYGQTINDVSDELFVVQRGEVEVIAADGTKLDVLGPGGIFGNLDESPRRRVSVSVVATCHVELLAIGSVKFHEVLARYPETQAEFRRVKAKFLNYISSDRRERSAAEAARSEAAVSIFTRTFDPRSGPIKMWRTFNLTYDCFFGFLIDLYQGSVVDYSGFVLATMYTCDMVYLADFLFKDHVAILDENGILVSDLKEVRRRNRANKWRHWLDFVSVIPIDALVLSLKLDHQIQNFLFQIFRLNRALRLMYVYEYFKTNKNRLDANLKLYSVGHIFLWTFLVMNSVSTIIGVVSCMSRVNLTPTIPVCSDLFDKSQEVKLNMYVHYLYTSLSAFLFTGQHFSFPQSNVLIVIFIAAMLVGLVTHALCLSQYFGLITGSYYGKTLFTDSVRKIVTFLQRERVSDALRVNVERFAEQSWLHQRGSAYPKLMLEAPLYLRSVVLNDAFSHVFLDHPVFGECHEDCLRQIVEKVTTRTYFRGDYVQHVGVVDNSMYFVFEGEVVVLRDGGEVNEVLKNGDSFGVYQGLFRCKPHSFTYKVLKTSIVLALELDSWSYLLDHFPASKEKIYSVVRE